MKFNLPVLNAILIAISLVIVVVGFALMVGEIALGRKTGLSAVGAFTKLNKKFAFVGVLASIVPMIILPYYCVIGGWVTKYLASFSFGGAKNDLSSAFLGVLQNGTFCGRRRNGNSTLPL